jgi:hypothetical protein
MIEAKLSNSLNEIRGWIGYPVAGAEDFASTEPFMKVLKAHCRLNAKCGRELTSRTSVKRAGVGQLSVYRLHRSKGIFSASKN